MAKTKPTSKPQTDQDRDDQFQTEDDARTLQRHAEIVQDPGRHKKATDHLGKQAKQMKDAHKMAKLHQRVKKGLKGAFGGGQTFQSEKDSEEKGMEEVVRQDD